MCDRRVDIERFARDALLLRLVVSIIQLWVSSYVRVDCSMQSTSFENRTRFVLCLFKAVRVVWDEKPLFAVRPGASDWPEGPEKDSNEKWLQWGIEQTILGTGELKKLNFDRCKLRGKLAGAEVGVGREIIQSLYVVE